MKSDTEKVLDLLVKHGVYPSIPAALLRDRRWLTWQVPPYGYWYGLRSEQGHKTRLCWTNTSVVPGMYLVWDERVVRERGPNKKFVRTKFAIIGSSYAAKVKAKQRRDKQ